MKKTTEKALILILVLILILQFIPFKVFANDSYTISFSISTNAIGYHDAQTDTDVQHSITEDGTRLVIDGQYVEPRLASQPNENFTGYTISKNGNTYEMTITNGEEVILNFNSANHFDLFANGNPINYETTFNTNTDIAIQDANNNQNPQQQSQTYNVNFGTATWKINDADVTATIAEKTINNSQNIVIEYDEIINLTGFNSETMEVRITEDIENNPFSTMLTVDTNDGVTTTKIANHTNDGGIPQNLIFTVQPKSNNPEPGDDNRFDGKAYYVWLNAENQICYHKFENLAGSYINEEQNIEYTMNYINVTQLVDQSENNSEYTWGQENANWVLAKDMEDDQGELKELTKEYIFGNENERGVQLDPCGAINGANSICTNGDRNFRATIYKERYNAIKFSSTEKDYTYFPGFWDTVFFSSVVDISDTTESNPAEYYTYLLEPTIKFTKDDFSREITAIEALNINQDAVEIRIEDGFCMIEFKSNYYDNVIFKITCGEKYYYIKINRLVIDVTDNFGPDTSENKLFAELYYPNDKTYNDYEVVAVIVYKDGSTETKMVTANKYYSRDNVNDRLIDEYTIQGGKGLNCSQFGINIDKDKVAGAYFTVINKGALDGENYGGTFSGSGEGSYYNIETRKVEL